MPHLMCVPCRIRCQSAGARGDLTDDLCPSCGAPWKPVDELSSVLGFRLIPAHDDGAAESDETRWLDDGGDGDMPLAVAVAVALPLPRG